MKQLEIQDCKPFGWIPTLLFVFMACWMVLFQQTEIAVAFSVIDDAMYYPKLALNIVSRGIMSYDGITTTNGFHPLWLIMLIPVYLLTTDPFVALKLVFIYVFAILLICCFILARICRQLKFSIDGLFVAFFVILLNLRSFTIFFSLMESHLVLLSYLLYLTYSFEYGDKRFTDSGHSFATGLLLGICFLARIDSFLLAISYGLVLIFTLRAGKASIQVFARSAFLSLSGCIILVGPYLMSNLLLFGHLSTVSASMKTSRNFLDGPEIVLYRIYYEFIPRLQYVLRLDFLPAYAVAVGLTVVLVPLCWLCLRKAKRDRIYENFRPVSDYMVFAVIHLIFICFVTPVEAVSSAWYMVPEIVAVGLILGACTPTVRISKLRLAPLAVVGLVGLQILYYPSFVQLKKMTFAKLQVADYIRNNLPENVRGGMIDSGIVSYFAQRDFVGLNGLIGDFETAELVAKKKHRELAKKYGINILVLDTPDILIPELRDNIIFQSSVRSKFVNFREPEKPFVVFQVNPDEFERIWDLRYERGFTP